MYEEAFGYLRLSDDDKKIGESSSIQSQRLIIDDYCRKNQIKLVKCFVDDGFSGGNFNRPGFNQLLEAIQTMKIDFVITKDLSRLGRDMRESSYYAETFFPEHNIRYIAINDNYDSWGENTMAPFQFAMNDVYLRDGSRKVRAALDIKRNAGEYCSCPPYGYKKDGNDHKVLIPDENTAPVVKKIFELAAAGYSTRKITDYLNENGIIPPLKYRVDFRDHYTPKGASRKSDTWNYVTVKRILRNEVYLGNTILGKSRKVSIKSSKKIPVEKSKWAYTEGTHAALVTREMFDRVQQNLSVRSSEWRTHERVRKSIFNGLIFCDCCGAALCSAGTVYKGERMKYWYLQCNNLPKRSAKQCAHPARIKYADLLEIIRSELNSFIDLTPDEIDDIARQMESESQKSHVLQDLQKSLQAAKSKSENIDRMMMKLYQDNLDGKITDERLNKMIQKLEEDAKILDDRAKELEQKISSVGRSGKNFKQFFDLVKSYTHLRELTAEDVRMFIERIEVGERILPPGVTVAGPKTSYRQEIRIYYKFIGNIAEDPIKTVEKAI